MPGKWPANYLQVGDDSLQMPSWSGAVLPGWCVYPHFVHRRQVAAAVGGQRVTCCATYKDYGRSARLRSVGPGDMEQPSCRTEDFNSVHRDICKKTQKSSLRLLAPLRTLSNWRYINGRIHHSFIHSFNSGKYIINNAPVAWWHRSQQGGPRVHTVTAHPQYLHLSRQTSATNSTM